MKIALLNIPIYSKSNKNFFLTPSTFDVPLNLCYLAAHIPDKHKVKIIDINLELIEKFGFRRHNKFFINPMKDRKVMQYVCSIFLRENLSQYDVIGLNGDNYPVCRIIARKARQMCSKSHIIVGGHIATKFWKKTLFETGADYVVLGEGELVFRNLINCLASGGNPKKLRGIAYPVGKKAVRNPPEQLLSAEEIRNPRYELVRLNRYYDLIGMTPILSSRGCTGRCIFCSRMMDFSLRFHNPKRVVSQIEKLKKEFGFVNFQFYNNAINVDKRHLQAMCKEIIKRKLRINWTCLARIENLDEKTIKLMAKAGCRRMSFGVESYSERLLSIIKKNIKLDESYEIIKNCKRYGIITRGSFIFNLPGEKFSDILNTLNFVFKSGLDIADFHDLRIIAGSELYDFPERYFNARFIEKDMEKKEVMSIKRYLSYLPKYVFFRYFLNKLFTVKNYLGGLYYKRKYKIAIKQ